MPVTAIGYVVTAFAARFILGESISPSRWAGIVLITAGSHAGGPHAGDKKKTRL